MSSPRYLFSSWDDIKDSIRGRYVYLFLDYDGTLAPIACTPERAALGRGARDLLERLAGARRCKVAIVSGRALCDISRRVGIKTIAYVGNHGLEMRGPGLKFKRPVSLKRKIAFDRVALALAKEFSGVKGVIVENKGLSLSLHYRQVARARIPSVKSAFRRALARCEAGGAVCVRQGKMVLDVRPLTGWNKGKAVLWIMKHWKFARKWNARATMPIYLGDDHTDEDAFRSLKGAGLTIVVGCRKRSFARYYLKSVRETIDFLKEIEYLMKTEEAKP